MEKKLGLICLSLLTIATLTCKAQHGGNSSAAGTNAKVYPGMNHSIPDMDMDNVVHIQDSISGQDIWLVGGEPLNNNSLLFLESERKPGFPEGWFTNSKLPILQKTESGQPYIDLSGQDNVFVGKLIEVTGQQSLILTLGYKSENYETLLVREFNNDNEILTETTQELLNGSFDKKTIKIDLNPQTERLMLQFQKNSKGFFHLTMLVLNH